MTQACPSCQHRCQRFWRFCPMCGRELEPLEVPEASQLEACADDYLREMLKRVERRDLALALTDPTWSRLKDRFLANLPSGARRDLEDEWSYRQPEPEAMHRAQCALLECAALLNEEGVIHLSRPDEVWVTQDSAEPYRDQELERAIEALDEAGIQRLLRVVDKKPLTFALFAVPPALRRLVYEQMSQRAETLMEEEMAFFGRLPLADLQEAQAHLKVMIMQTAEEGMNLSMASLLSLVSEAPEHCLRVWAVVTIDQYERIHGDGTCVSLERLCFTKAAAEAWAAWIARHSTKTEENSHDHGYDTEVHELRLFLEGGCLQLSRAKRYPEPPGALLHEPPNLDAILATFNGTNQRWKQTLTHCRNLWPEAPLPRPEEDLSHAEAAPFPIPPPLHRIFTGFGPTFEVRDVTAARATFQDYEAVVSLVDPGTELDWPRHPKHFVFPIWDVTTPKGITPDQVNTLLGIDLKGVWSVLVHCEVGVSRSPAVAMLLATRWGASDGFILQGIDWAKACPNRRILELGEAALGAPRRLQDLVEGGRSLLQPLPAAIREEPTETPARHRILLPDSSVLDVRGLPEAKEILHGYDAVISLLDPWAEVDWESHPCHWIFRVRDIEGEADFSPSVDLVRQILSLDIPPHGNLLVHCHEGFSRSTATAILLATMLGASREAILEGIDWTHAYPNQRILAFGEEILGTGGTLKALVEEGLQRGGWR